MQKEQLAKMIIKRADEYGDSIALKYKTGGTWHEISYKKLGVKIREVAIALLDSGIKEGDRVAIFSQNRYEWAIADFGIMCARGISVPVYATNTREQAEYIIKDASVRLVFTGEQDQYDKIFSIAESGENHIKIVSFDSDVKLKGNQSVCFSEFASSSLVSDKIGELEKRIAASDPDEIATIIYTSGTTGEPKGVMLTHSNFSHQAFSVEKNFDVGLGDRSLCFLPLSHVYERAWSFFIFKCGAMNCYLSNPKKAIEYMGEVRPNVMVSVPRLYEKIYSTVYHKIEQASFLKRLLFKWAVSTGRKYAFRKKDGKPVDLALRLSHDLADRLVLKKLREIVGGDKKFFSAGGAALSQDIEEFFFSIGLLVCQGYGLTESSPMITYNTPGAFKFGTVGKPVPLCEVRIDESGEILARGPNIMKGYLNKPEETEKVIIDGWLRTGDIGEIDNDGFLRITGRIKDLIVLSTGKNIAPQMIETAVVRDHYIEQIAVVGDGRKYISAIVVPCFEALEEYARGRGLKWTTWVDLTELPEITDFYMERINIQSRGLAGSDKIKKFYIHSEKFSQKGGELTPTLKIRRMEVMKKYKDQIEAMYN